MATRHHQIVKNAGTLCASLPACRFWWPRKQCCIVFSFRACERVLFCTNAQSQRAHACPQAVTTTTRPAKVFCYYYTWYSIINNFFSVAPRVFARYLCVCTQVQQNVHKFVCESLLLITLFGVPCSTLCADVAPFGLGLVLHGMCVLCRLYDVLLSSLSLSLTCGERGRCGALSLYTRPAQRVLN